MKINGKEKDYYDSALDYSNSEQITWFRKMIIYTFSYKCTSKNSQDKAIKKAINAFNEKNKFKSFSFDFKDSGFFDNDFGIKSTIYITNGFVCFAGKVYPYIKIGDKSKNSEFFYDSDSFIKALSLKGHGEILNYITSRDYYRQKKTVKRKAITLQETVEAFFNVHNNNSSINQFHTAINSPIYIYDQYINSSPYKDSDFAEESFFIENQSCGIVSGRLSDYQFIKVMLPQIFVQELEMFMGNILISKDPTPLMSNDVKILSHGFDTKISFRKSKGK